MATITPGDDDLKGMRILVVEDEAMIAMALECTLEGFGCEVVGPATCLDDAIVLARDQTMDGAILDVNLAGKKVFPVAEILAERNIPFVFTTGYGSAGVREINQDRPVLQKPYQARSLAAIARQWRQHPPGSA